MSSRWQKNLLNKFIVLLFYQFVGSDPPLITLSLSKTPLTKLWNNSKYKNVVNWKFQSIKNSIVNLVKSILYIISLLFYTLALWKLIFLTFFLEENQNFWSPRNLNAIKAVHIIDFERFKIQEWEGRTLTLTSCPLCAQQFLHSP